MTDLIPCPCCREPFTAPTAAPFPHRYCPRCLHRWRIGDLTVDHYLKLSGRTPQNPRSLAQKHAERIAFIGKALDQASRVLDIGCAEGLFGEQVKMLYPGIKYVGIEISRDAQTAATRLDRVHHGTLDGFKSCDPFDLVVSFHVLEHIPDPADLLAGIGSRLSPRGLLVLETPCGSGNRIIPWDLNPEHLHFFTPVSLGALVMHAGYDVLVLESGGFESAVYDNTLRLRARRSRTEAQRERAYRIALEGLLGSRCLVYGVGGDFRNWVRPYLDDARVAAYLDAKAEHAPEPSPGRRAEPPEALLRHPDVPILIASYRYEDEIRARFTEDYAISPGRIQTLATVAEAARKIQDDA